MNDLSVSQLRRAKYLILEDELRDAIRSFLHEGGTTERLREVVQEFLPITLSLDRSSVSANAKKGLPKGQKPAARKAQAIKPATPKQKAAAKRVANKVASTVLDTFTITERQGSQTAIGDIRVASYSRIMGRLKKRAWVSSREYNLLYLLESEAQKIAHIPAGAKTRDIFDAGTTKRLIAMAADLAMPALQYEERPDD